MLRRLLILTSTVVFVDTMFYAVVAPLLPHFSDELGLSKASAGLLSAAYPAGTLLGSLPGGMLAARVGPKQTVLLGLTLLGVSSLAFGFVHQIVLLDTARFVQGVGGACSWAGALAWLVAEAPPDRRGALIGTALGAAIAGSLFGPVIGGVAEATSPEVVFGSVLVFAGVLGAWALRTPSTHEPVHQGVRDVAMAIRSPGVAAGMWLVALPALGFGALSVLGPLRLDAFGAGGAAIAATFLVAAAVEASISPIVGRVSDARGRFVPIRAGLASAAVVLLVVTVPHNAVLLAAVIVVTTGCLGMFWAPAMALLSDAAEGTGLSQGLAFALMNMAWGAGQVSGAGAGGTLAKATTDAVPLGVVAGLCLATLVVVLRHAPRPQPRPLVHA